MSLIEVRGLCKRFSGGARPLFRDLNLTFPGGEVTALTGPSGIGKTTLLHILMGLVSFDAGEILGVPRRQAAVFQENRLIPDLSAARNIALGCPGPLSRAVVLEHLGRVGLAENADAPAGALSGGMARRAAVVRACLAPADILFMDEPFAGLDPASTRQTLEYVRETRGARTLLAVVHDRAHAEALGGEILDLEALMYNE
ncbi:MAG: ABC transporter ATP-binding protein [Fretibacterium sp.]|nr:ABC transporter ATP-binding protein [Fretibacterium sp.]